MSKLKFTIHYLENAVIDDSQENRVAIYDVKEGGHGISIPIEKFWRMAEVLKKKNKEDLK